MKNLKYVNNVGGISGEYPDDSENAGHTLYIGTSGALYDKCVAGEFGPIASYIEPQIDINAVRSTMVVTRFQAKAAIYQSGLMPAVEAIMSNPATDALVKMAWTDALEFKRMSPTVIVLAQALGLTDEQLDTLFTTAKGIEV